jgi:hypothetical protein
MGYTAGINITLHLFSTKQRRPKFGVPVCRSEGGMRDEMAVNLTEVGLRKK